MFRRVLCALFVASAVVATATFAAPPPPLPSSAADTIQSASMARYLQRLANRDPVAKLDPALGTVADPAL